MSNKVVPMSHCRKQWVNDENGIVNARFGKIIVGQVINGETRADIFEVPTISEKKGAIYVVVDVEEPECPRIAFVKQVRPVVIDPVYLNTVWGKGVPDISDPEIQEHMGVLATELPRGFTFGKDILSEAEEETQFVVEYVDNMGNINSNTANYTTSPEAVVAKATKAPSGRIQPPDEKIVEVVWLTRDEIFEQVDLCCFSLGMITKFRAWCSKNPDEFWKKIGEKF